MCLSMFGGHVKTGDHHEVGFAEVDSGLQSVRHGLQGFQILQRVHLVVLLELNCGQRENNIRAAEWFLFLDPVISQKTLKWYNDVKISQLWTVLLRFEHTAAADWRSQGLVKADSQQRAKKESPFFSIFNIVCVYKYFLCSRWLIRLPIPRVHRRCWLWK